MQVAPYTIATKFFGPTLEATTRVYSADEETVAERTLKSKAYIWYYDANRQYSHEG